MNKIPLPNCVLCRDCANKVEPKAIGSLTTKSLISLGYCGCSVDNDTYLIEADRNCQNYKPQVVK